MTTTTVTFRRYVSTLFRAEGQKVHVARLGEPVTACGQRMAPHWTRTRAATTCIVCSGFEERAG